MGKSRGERSCLGSCQCQWSVVSEDQSIIGRLLVRGIAELGREFKLLKPPFSAVVGKASRFTK
jgi:hypothetical protein